MDLFKLVGKIAIENSEANKSLSETQSKAKDTAEDVKDLGNAGEKTQSKFSAAMGKIGSAAVKVGKVVAVGIGAAATAIGAVTVKALNAAGELEQNMGGSEAVFGEHAAKMQETAKKAFSNMGLSTSDYLATANKMGALFQGAGFEVKESMELSQNAMQRAADVASIMGIDTASAMEAVAGAAKGNFTMMDNLGVAMNETTLANYALEKGMKKSYDQMTQQEKIGVAMEMFLDKTAYAAGNYAKENETLAGALGTAKAALSNFLSGSGSVEDVVSSISNAANVVVKNISSLFPSLMSGITQIVNQLTPMIPPLLEQVLPGLIEGATGLINGLVSALPSVVDVLTDSALPMLLSGIVTIFNSLVSALPSLVESICSALPSLIPLLIDGLVSMVVTLCTSFSDIIKPLIDNLPDIIISLCDAIISNLPILIDGLISLIIGVVAATPQIIKALVDSLPEVIEMLITGLLKLVPKLIKGFTDMAKGVSKASKSIWKSVGYAIINVFIGIWNSIKNVFAPLGKWFSTKFKEAKDRVMKAWSDVKTRFSNIWNGIKSVFSNVGAWFKNLFTNAKNNVVNAWSSVKAKFTSIKNGIVSAFSNVKEKLTAPFQKARDIIKGIADKIKGFFKGEISMPKIKVPHFSIKPKGWKIGDLLDGVKPSLGIEWYAKAVNNPMIMKSPTVFGYNETTNSLRVGGETEDEVISGTQTLMNMIGNTVESRTSAPLNQIVSLLVALIDAVNGGNKDLLKGILAGQKIVLNNREVARTVREYA